MFITYSDNKKIRLDKYLVGQYPNISRSQIQKAIKNGDVLVDGNETTVHHFLKSGEKIEIKKDFGNIETRQCLVSTTANNKIKLNIITETDDYIIINKPAGMLVHPTDKGETDTLANGLLAYCPEIENAGDTQPTNRRGIVHRLDREVSGLLVVAKTQDMFERLKKQFQNRTVKKEYIALVHGQMENNSGTIDFPIGINKDTGKMAARPKSVETQNLASLQSKTAITTYEVLKQFQQYSLLKVQIKTGRTHQIRVHLNALKHPIVGDKTYRPKNLHSRIKLDRIFLHAQTLGFNDIKGEWCEFNSELPKQLNSFLKTLS
jgi:23S rRNA pseudouridine1911/1915/1917 synthase